MGIPMRSSAAEHSRPTLWDALVVLAVLVAAVLIFFQIRPSSSNFLTATVVLGDETIAQYDLNALTAPITLPLTNCPYPLMVEAEHGRIRISESTCPGGDCVRTGWANMAGQQIICLPNKLIISLSGQDGNPIDAVTG